MLRPSVCGISSESKPARPRARCVPDSSSIHTGSPAEKSPYTSRAPAASNDARPPRMALAAPASTTIVPRGSAAKPIHRRREDPRALTGANTVPTGSPIIAGPAFEAHVSTVGIPETAATRAASSFVTMPPVPTLDPEPDTWISPSASITLGTYSTRRDPG